jgi:hypothetical protein
MEAGIARKAFQSVSEDSNRIAAAGVWLAACGWRRVDRLLALPARSHF